MRLAERHARPGLSRLPLLLTVVVALGALATAQTRIDLVTPMAPELAPYGASAIGVRTLQVTDPNRVDILRTVEGQPTRRYDRRLTLEVWYPATVPTGTPASDYRTIAIDPTIPVTLRGRAVRDAVPQATGGPYPLVVISHGYPGNRYLLSHLGENLASKGFVTVSIDHAESTYDDRQAFASTLYNRSPDQLFVVREMARLGASGSGSPLAGLVDADRTGIVGYSMGGYGVMNTIGGSYSPAAVTLPGGPPNRLLAERTTAAPGYRTSLDARIRAAIAIGPWGMQRGYWDAEGLAGVRTPVLFVAGSADEISGYDKGTRALFTGVVHADRYLLTFMNAGHNAAAPYPAPAEVIGPRHAAAFAHYADAAWDTVRMNNILAHFATAWFDLQLKGDVTKTAYLDGAWKGFARGAAVGLRLEHAAARPLAAAP